MSLHPELNSHGLANVLVKD